LLQHFTYYTSTSAETQLNAVVKTQDIQQQQQKEKRKTEKKKKEKKKKQKKKKDISLHT